MDIFASHGGSDFIFDYRRVAVANRGLANVHGRSSVELARHGVAVRIVDRSPGIDPHVRANLLHSGTLEIFETLGIAEATIEG
jgi:hypothetical protein